MSLLASCPRTSREVRHTPLQPYSALGDDNLPADSICMLLRTVRCAVMTTRLIPLRSPSDGSGSQACPTATVKRFRKCAAVFACCCEPCVAQWRLRKKRLLRMRRPMVREVRHVASHAATYEAFPSLLYCSFWKGKSCLASMRSPQSGSD